MGEVYRATDTKLGRDVAIKILPESFAQDPERMARFQREAQVLAALNHPNIAQIHAIEEGALVMELVEGEPLHGALPVETALDYARQIADAIGAAHGKGITHRDLKPANIMVTPQGVVKVLDFGLAAVAQTSSGDPTTSPTLTMSPTRAGMILGTAAYMSPEQARGKPVDKRADIWAFGVVLFEMLTGEQLFHGETISDTLAAVLTKEPDLTRVPATVRLLLQSCLQKDSKQRLQAIGDWRLLLEDALSAQAGDLRRLRWPWAIAAGGLILAVAGWWRAPRPAELRPAIRMNVEMSTDLPLANVTATGVLALSPDGEKLAVTLRGADGKVRIYNRPLDQMQITPLAGTEGADTPFFSPDSQWIGFQADRKLRKIPVQGGAPITLCDAPGMRGASWGDDGYIVFSPGTNSPLFRVSGAGGAPAPLTKLEPGEATHRWPQVLPRSQTVLFMTQSSGGNVGEGSNIEAFSIQTGQRKTVQRGAYSGRYVVTPRGSGRLLYLQQGKLFAAPFDLDRLAISGTAVPVIEQVSNAASGGGHFAFSANGTFVYLPGEADAWKIVWTDASGKTNPLHASPGRHVMPRFSPDGKRLAFGTLGGNGSIWVKDLDRDTLSRLTSLDGDSHMPVWTPDGRNIIFRSVSPSKPGLYWIRSDGSGEPHRLTDGKRNVWPYSISPNGKRLALFQSEGAGGNYRIFTAPIEGDPASPKLGEPELFLGTTFAQTSPAFSPDGHWLAYVSDESGTTEIYVRPLPGPGGRWPVSTGGGTCPVWSRTGQELLFQAPDERVMAASYTAKGDSITFEKPRVWTETRLMTYLGFPTWDLAPDGKRLAAIVPVDYEKRRPSTHLAFILNFFDELQRRTQGASPAGGK
jgi:serine/threonine-protein kinase